jgi:hypothetical protein
VTTKIHESTRASGKPRTASAIVAVTVQPGRLRCGKVVLATSITSQAVTAYAAAMR